MFGTTVVVALLKLLCYTIDLKSLRRAQLHLDFSWVSRVSLRGAF